MAKKNALKCEKWEIPAGILDNPAIGKSGEARLFWLWLFRKAGGRLQAVQFNMNEAAFFFNKVDRSVRRWCDTLAAAGLITDPVKTPEGHSTTLKSPIWRR
jgi:hypothetical protein